MSADVILQLSGQKTGLGSIWPLQMLALADGLDVPRKLIGSLLVEMTVDPAARRHRKPIVGLPHQRLKPMGR